MGPGGSQGAAPAAGSAESRGGGSRARKTPAGLTFLNFKAPAIMIMPFPADFMRIESGVAYGIQMAAHERESRPFFARGRWHLCGYWGSMGPGE